MGFPLKGCFGLTIIFRREQLRKWRLNINKEKYKEKKVEKNEL